MANLTLRKLPESTLAGELLAIIDFVVAHPEKVSVDDYLWTDPVAAQKRDILAAAGAWRDSRTEAEVIKDIESHRTKGREVSL